MVDRTRLLGVVNGTDIAGIHPSLKLLCDAARAVVEAPERRWCKNHDLQAFKVKFDIWRCDDHVLMESPCAVTRVFLVPAEEEL
jgi:hypothetical protein